MITLNRLQFALPALILATLAPAQTATEDSQPVSTVSVKVNVVNVLATVRDKKGKIVNTLGKDDFSLADNGQTQSIHYFSRESDLPLTLGLLVDTSLSQRRVLEQERNASHGFLDQIMRADQDKSFIIHFDREVELLQDLTNSLDKLESALNSLQAPELSRSGNGGGGNGGGRTGNDPSGGGYPSGRRGFGGGGTQLYDAVYLASDELMKKQQGRKAIIILSDGVDHGSKETLETAIETAQRADTLVYSILFKDDEEGGRGFGGNGGPRISMGGPGMGGGGMGRRGGGGRGYPPPQEHVDGKKILERLSRETGARMFEVSKKEPIDSIYAQIEEELRNQYNLGFTPDQQASTQSGYHKIVLTAKQNGLVVQARDGYYPDRQ